MFGKLLLWMFGNKNTRTIKRMRSRVAAVNALETKYKAFGDADFSDQTAQFRQQLAQGASLDDLLPEAFAAAREAGVRALGQRHYDVQLMGGIVLHQGHVAEMRTGEGKTLVATLAAYLNALPGEGVHVVTVNDYLARRDANWMQPLYNLLGLTVGIILSGQSQEQKREAYAADITYGTNNEFGFDYLRDNMVFTLEDRAQRASHYAIVDEVDSILIDEARTPLIISGATEDDPDLYRKIDKLVIDLNPHVVTEETGLPAIDRAYLSDDEIEAQGHYVLDEKNRSVDLTEKGHGVIEGRLHQAGLLPAGDNLYSATNLGLLHHVQAALKAQVLFRKDVDYLVRNNEIVIVDEHTGRLMTGRRWSDGLHQAIEAKEGVSIQNESQTLASTTFQNYFRLYDKLSGMTGTADTEAFELQHIYGLDVVIVPTNQPMVRKDMNDLIYMTVAEKFHAIIEDVQECVQRGVPVLVGTTSVEASELLSAELNKNQIAHQVLNAKRHQQEAVVIAQAGQPATVTIATNMAGRGTDIVLGGNWEVALDDTASEQDKNEARMHWQSRHDAVITAGGLHIIGTERHESRRIDNQLRGRSGRQGDPGSSRFYLSMEDNLLRIFASERMRSIMQGLGMDWGEAIEHRMVTSAIERAQRKVESRNFDIRKGLLEYDDVANHQRQAIYAQRRELMVTTDISETVAGMREEIIQDVIDGHIPPGSLYEQWNLDSLEQALAGDFGSQQPVVKWFEEDEALDETELRTRILQQIEDEYRAKEEIVGTARMRALEKGVMLITLDRLWKEHLAAMDHLRQGISLRAYAQKQPKQEYKREAFELFRELLYSVRHTAIQDLSRIQTQSEQDIDAIERERRAKQAKNMQLVRPIALSADLSDSGNAPSPPLEDETLARTRTPFMRSTPKVGRNKPCPCGSGKKYKFCHGRKSG